MSNSPVRATVDFGKQGKQYGHLYVPYSYNLGGWANLMLPVCVIGRGSGPTALVMAGWQHSIQCTTDLANAWFAIGTAGALPAGRRPRMN